MAAIHKMCSEILEKVELSGLDFNINQTPYSIHFSIRKKFSKVSRTSNQSSSRETINIDAINLNDNLRRELLNMRNEYEKLFNFYTFEAEQKSKLELELVKETELKKKTEEELADAYNQIKSIEQKESQTKRLKEENKKLEETVAIKVLELKHLKSEVEEMKKEKNSLSVALKGSRKSIKEYEKASEKEKLALEKTIGELKEFKRKKLDEEREERARKKKEIKKAAKLMKTSTDDAHSKESTSSAEQTISNKDQTPSLKKEDAPENPATSDYLKTDPNGNLDSKDDTETDIGTEDDFLNENAEGFIGPKLPPRMTKEEIDAFYKEMMAKFKLDDLLKPS